jgi:hypothetical protein
MNFDSYGFLFKVAQPFKKINWAIYKTQFAKVAAVKLERPEES